MTHANPVRTFLLFHHSFPFPFQRRQDAQHGTRRVLPDLHLGPLPDHHPDPSYAVLLLLHFRQYPLVFVLDEPEQAGHVAYFQPGEFELEHFGEHFGGGGL